MNILAITEQRDNKFKKSAYEIVRTARTIADQTGGDVIALVIGDHVQAIAGELAGYGATKIIVVQQPTLAKYSSTAYAKVIAETAYALAGDKQTILEAGFDGYLPKPITIKSLDEILNLNLK